jgi:RNA polymerase sigma-70 factor (ECF subfamily)
VQRLEAGSALSFEDLYRQHGRRLWWAVLAFSGDREVANDAVAEAFAQAIRRGDAVHDALAWIWRSAFRIAAGELKRRRRFTPEVPDIAYEAPESAATLLDSLARLSPNQRAAVVLRYYADLPVAEIAAILGTAETTVSVHLHRGRKRLRDLLEAHDD